MAPATAKAQPVLSVLVIDDSLLIRMALKQLIAEEYRGAAFGEARTGEEALALLPKQHWSLVILDISLPDQDAFSLLEKICNSHAGTESRVLMLGTHGDDLCAARAMQLGAAGYVSTSLGRRDLLQAFKSVLAGKKFFHEPLSRDMAPKREALRANLSAREYEVLLAFARGKQTSEIAVDLNLSSRTISTFKRRMLNKLQLNSTADLVRYAIDHKLA
jgi:DNA-binding NarL/FixJ family response regulator